MLRACNCALLRPLTAIKAKQLHLDTLYSSCMFEFYIKKGSTHVIYLNVYKVKFFRGSTGLSMAS